MTELTRSAATDLFRAPPQRIVDLGDRGVAVRSVGTGPDVLFVHGWPVSGATFRALLPHLVSEVTCHVIDLPGTGSSPVPDGPTTVATHIESVAQVVGALGLDDVAVVGHDSGGLIARHALAGDSRVRAMGLIDTEPTEVGWRFRSFLSVRRLPGLAAGLGWISGSPRIRRSRAVFGDAFVDRSLLEGEFDEFFLRPLHQDRRRRQVAAEVLASFDLALVRSLSDLHHRIDVPVQLVWGERDVFFPVDQAQRMVATFADARLTVVPGAGLFSHEERPAEVAAALLPALTAPR
jgi:pimeloyl-ACP methyl ester carboxylesterase